MTKDSYTISAIVLKQVLECLHARWFISLGDGDCDNDHEVIEATKALEAEIESQETP